MRERPYSRYTRAKTWSAIYSQHLNAGFALVPHSLTNNSIEVIRCATPEDALQVHQRLLSLEPASEEEPFQVPGELLPQVRIAVVLARSSDFWHYALNRYHPAKGEFGLVICGLHDSYLHLPVWETRSNRRFKRRETALLIGSPEFEQVRATPYGHSILIGALVAGDRQALAYLESDKIPKRTRWRIKREVDDLHHRRYRGRPMAFRNEDERREVGAKISLALKQYYAKRTLGGAP